MDFRKLIYAASVILAFSCSGYVDPGQEDAEEDDGQENVTPPATDVVSDYRQQMVAMQFTSTGCTNCPLLATALKNIRKNMPGTIIPVAFHMDYDTPDPMSLPVCTRFYEKVSMRDDKVIGLPMFALNFTRPSEHIVNEYAKIASEIDKQQNANPVRCGVALQAEYSAQEKQVSVTARFKSDVEAPFRYHILLLEDGISYPQAGSDVADYVHDNVLRAVSADDVRGDRLDSGRDLVPRQEYVIEKTFTVADSWNVSNLKVVAAMLTLDEASAWYSNNANVCPVGGSADYQYIQK